MVLLPGGSYDFDFRTGRQFGFSAVPQTGNDGSVSMTVTLEGSGRHSLAVRTDNLSLAPSIRQVELQAGQPQTITMQGKMTALDAPWVAVLVADDDVMQRKEITGAVRRP